MFRPIKQINEISRFLLLGQNFRSIVFSIARTQLHVQTAEERLLNFAKCILTSLRYYYYLLLVGLFEFSRVKVWTFCEAYIIWKKSSSWFWRLLSKSADLSKPWRIFFSNFVCFSESPNLTATISSQKRRGARPKEGVHP